MKAETVRSSKEEFDAAPVAVSNGKKSGLSDLEKVGLLALGALVVGSLLKDGREVVSNTGDQGPIAKRLTDLGEGVHLVAMKVDDIEATLVDLRAKGIRLVGDPGAGNPVKGQVFIHPSVTGGVLTQLVQR